MAGDRRHELAEIFADADLVDAIFDYVLAQLPEMRSRAIELGRIKAAVRDEYGGQKVYVAKRRAQDRADVATQVLAHFNGRNATEVARKLGISRATVYRLIKQPAAK
jgi:Mor family transcriptional regulator